MRWKRKNFQAILANFNEWPTYPMTYFLWVQSMYDWGRIETVQKFGVLQLVRIKMG